MIRRHKPESNLIIPSWLLSFNIHLYSNCQTDTHWYIHKEVLLLCILSSWLHHFLCLVFSPALSIMEQSSHFFAYLISLSFSRPSLCLLLSLYLILALSLSRGACEDHYSSHLSSWMPYQSKCVCVRVVIGGLKPSWGIACKGDTPTQIHTCVFPRCR